MSEKIEFENLRAEMARAGVSLAELAKSIGMGVSTIYNKRSGLQDWTLAEMTAIQNMLQEKDITKLIKTLDKREQEIIKRRFGIDNREPKTLEQIGNAMGFSKERIRQIENHALQKLRRVDNVHCLKSYLDVS